MAEAFEGLFPRDDPANTRFSINFFTSIGKSWIYGTKEWKIRKNKGILVMSILNLC